MSHRLFVVDMDRCIGCNACIVACKDRAGLPDDLDFLRIERVESGKYPKVDMYYRVMHCFHCEKPPCVDVCPAGALSKKDDGFVHLNVESCSNCGMCKEVCPYDSIIEVPEGFHAKCDGCFDEVSKGWDPTCVRACLMRALSFKPIDEVDARHRMEKDTRGPEFRPRVIYLQLIK